MSRNLFHVLADALPDAPVLVGRVISHNSDDTSTVELPIGLPTTSVGATGVFRGSVIRPRGRTVPVGGWAFVRRGRIENRAPSPEGDSVLLPPLPRTPVVPSSSVWRSDVVMHESTAVAVIDGVFARFGAPPTSFVLGGYATMGTIPRTSGRRYFEIRANGITRTTNVGFAVGTYLQPDPELSAAGGTPPGSGDALSLSMYDTSGGSFLRITPADAWSYAPWGGDGTAPDWTWPWDDLGLSFDNGGVYGFAFDLDIGRMELLTLNGVEIYPAATAASDVAAMQPFRTWAPATPVQPYLRWLDWRYYDPATTPEIELIGSPAVVPAGYIAWDAP